MICMMILQITRDKIKPRYYEMALIKCPECGEDISTAADVCPHCGFPLKKKTETKIEPKDDFPKPISSSWINEWKNKTRKTKEIWTWLFILSIIGFVISIVLLVNDQEIVFDGYYGGTYEEIKPVHLVFSIVFFLALLITFSFWISVLIGVRVRTRQFDSYIVLVYTGFKNLLIVENQIQDSGYFTRYLYGSLPNKKQVYASISAWDASVNIGIVKE